eukprot:CAMPEP_0119108234 /NCGR_PEP_ID=MMETSP1180-20130426/13539_1 /TAXON_ID=3052 ORGANISM="Chlamydomonas cf sp, Strain CCMP681" /NCGR_SAMPLE_ID=MMETSP1180 /ASSEMBLY_ACC=CAM_ASM_000741 /LENGTH=122 /DNA_ID=CAMNT_0007093825 /DNA_START=11 /DNA_END=379 /DNA_ORIENTATION=-
MLAATRGAFAARVAVRPSMGMAGRAMVAPVARPFQSSSFLGGSMAPCIVTRAPSRGALQVVASKVSMGCTINGKGSNKKRRTTSGYRTRAETPSGRAILKARRKKGRAVLCTASMKKSGGKK